MGSRRHPSVKGSEAIKATKQKPRDVFGQGESISQPMPTRSIRRNTRTSQKSDYSQSLGTSIANDRRCKEHFGRQSQKKDEVHHEEYRDNKLFEQFHGASVPDYLLKPSCGSPSSEKAGSWARRSFHASPGAVSKMTGQSHGDYGYESCERDPCRSGSGKDASKKQSEEQGRRRLSRLSWLGTPHSIDKKEEISSPTSADNSDRSIADSRPRKSAGFMRRSFRRLSRGALDAKASVDMLREGGPDADYEVDYGYESCERDPCRSDSGKDPHKKHSEAQGRRRSSRLSWLGTPHSIDKQEEISSPTSADNSDRSTADPRRRKSASFMKRSFRRLSRAALDTKAAIEKISDGDGGSDADFEVDYGYESGNRDPCRSDSDEDPHKEQSEEQRRRRSSRLSWLGTSHSIDNQEEISSPSHADICDGSTADSRRQKSAGFTRRSFRRISRGAFDMKAAIEKLSGGGSETDFGVNYGYKSSTRDLRRPDSYRDPIKKEFQEQPSRRPSRLSWLSGSHSANNQEEISSPTSIDNSGRSTLDSQRKKSSSFMRKSFRRLSRGVLDMKAATETVRNDWKSDGQSSGTFRSPGRSKKSRRNSWMDSVGPTQKRAPKQDPRRRPTWMKTASVPKNLNRLNVGEAINIISPTCTALRKIESDHRSFRHFLAGEKDQTQTQNSADALKPEPQRRHSSVRTGDSNESFTRRSSALSPLLHALLDQAAGAPTAYTRTQRQPTESSSRKKLFGDGDVECKSFAAILRNRRLRGSFLLAEGKERGNKTATGTEEI